MAWRLVRSLDRLRTQVRAAAPRAVPPATAASAWGTIGDALHTSTSDHSPHTYAALGSTPVVCAADFPHAPALGLDGGVFAEALRRSRDPRIAYVIFNRRIFSSTNSPWTWRAYTGSDPHDTHWHVSVVHTAAADDTRDWAMPGTAGATGDDMQLNEPVNWAKQYTWESYDPENPWLEGTFGQQFQHVRETTFWTNRRTLRLEAKVAALTALLEKVLAAGGGNVDVAALMAHVDEKLAELAADTRDAVADLGEGGAAQVRGEQQ